MVESDSQNLVTSINPIDLEGVLNLLDKVVTPNRNHMLLKPYTPNEVKRALFSMYPSKCPRPDGMSPFFFQKYWHIVGNDVTNGILFVLQSGHFLRKMSNTHIVLIPKINEPKSVSNY